MILLVNKLVKGVNIISCVPDHIIHIHTAILILQFKSSCSNMFILGSCVYLQQKHQTSYCGCCKWSLSPECHHVDCYCDERCHKYNDCCFDIAEIGCYSNW